MIQAYRITSADLYISKKFRKGDSAINYTLWIPARTTKGTACLWAASATIFNPTGAITPPLLITAWAPTITFRREEIWSSKKKTKFNLHGNYKAFIVVYHIHPGNHCKNCRISNYSGLKAPHNQFLSKRMSLISGFNQTNRKWYCH